MFNLSSFYHKGKREISSNTLILNITFNTSMNHCSTFFTEVNTYSTQQVAWSCGIVELYTDLLTEQLMSCNVQSTAFGKMSASCHID